MGSIQIFLRFLMVYSFVINSEGKLVKIIYKVTPSTAAAVKLKNIILKSLFFSNVSNRGRMAIISMKLHLYILKRLKKKFYKKLYSFYVININVKWGNSDHFGFGMNCYTIHHLWSSDSAGYPLIQTFMYNNSV